MTATAKAMSALMLAAILSLGLFLSPIGVSRAQDDTSEEETTSPDDSTDDATSDDDDDDRRGLTEEERAARMAERGAEQTARLQAVADELGVTLDELTTAFKTVALAEVEAKLDAGDITQEQADAITERIESADGIGGFGFGRGPGGRGHHGHGPRGGVDSSDGTPDQGI